MQCLIRLSKSDLFPLAMYWFLLTLVSTLKETNARTDDDNDDDDNNDNE